ncbi:imidazolonepropionase [Klebsiella quasivariicola]|uniref:imidazolonepropionase n=1 Tax=Klebsiella quasivariicola TaxID=2026240 RepID=UPI001642F1A1|nr:imidazolonepropionase [Klebsiella quasivariicola]
MVCSHKKITFPCAIVDFIGVMKINVYTTHDKLSAMTEATSERVIWRNARLATLNPDSSQPYGLLERHALLVRNGRIEAVVADADAPSGRSIDLDGRLVTPGLIDCHTHLIFGGSRAQEWEQRLNGVSYQTISANGGGINSTVRATRDSSEAELLALAQPRLARLLREGVTTLEIKSGYGLDLQNERKMLRVARQLADHNGVELSATLLSAHATPPEYHGDADGYISLVCETILPTLWQEGLFESVDVFCENVGFSPQQTERVFQAAQALGIPVKGHVEQLSSLGGAQLVSRYHGLSADHIEYLTEEGVAAMRESGTVAALLPSAFYFLNETRKPPVELLRKYQVPMAVATDFNPGTSPFASLHLAMNMACVKFGLTPEEAWAGVTRHAARALGRQNSHGQLAAGFVANFAIWDAEHPVEMVYEPGRAPLWGRVVRGERQ